MPGHARGPYIQQDDAAFYRITSISCYEWALLLLFQVFRTYLFFMDFVEQYMQHPH